MRFVEYTERSIDDSDIDECEIVYVSRSTGEIVAKSLLSETTKSEIMDMYDDNRVFISGSEYKFNGMNLNKVSNAEDLP